MFKFFHHHTSTGSARGANSKPQTPSLSLRALPVNPSTPFAALSAAQKRAVAGRVVRSLRSAGALGRGYYNPVTRDQDLRTRVSPEKGGEETALTSYERNKLIALVRDLDRNSEHLNAFLKQLELNVVGRDGGLASFDFPESERDKAVAIREAFADWAQECEFFDGLDLQTLLKLALRTKFITGRALMLFDDGLVSDSGKVILFEGDEIANIPAAEFIEKFPGFTQHQGIIKDAHGVTRGAFVSQHFRGVDTFPRTTLPDGSLAVWPLIRGENVRWKDAPFALYQNLKRINQVVSVPGFAPVVGAVHDLGDLTKYELQTAKKQAQTLATVTQADNQPDNLTDGLDPDISTPISESSTDDEVAAAIEAETGGDDYEAPEALDLPAIEGAGAIYDVLPPGLKMELLSPTHPNQNVIGMVDWLKRNVSWANGAASLYATGKADSSYSASLVEQAMTWQMFYDEQHMLETSVLDWLIRRWAAWAARKGAIDARMLPDHWTRRVRWNWPVKHESDAKSEQSALSSGLKNLTMSLREYYGADWRESLDKLNEELTYCRELGIPHPALQTVSGQIIDENLSTEQPASNEGKNK